MYDLSFSLTGLSDMYVLYVPLTFTDSCDSLTCSFRPTHTVEICSFLIFSAAASSCVFNGPYPSGCVIRRITPLLYEVDAGVTVSTRSSTYVAMSDRYSRFA
ncbi:hypothetical protein WS86_00090 (plasmid) [Burkholderia savannae]|uniref:Uncharacterized protein n=1 Tax=Burkholderia savannae TaxID=1637837 RepID=A0ABR5T9N5_9BURK|nr:hypothetical protein WS86_00090 [Burkholderia savannae]KWZ39574.1 hypothetical protein WS72_19415 [Burkholderia savannae]